MDHYSLSVQALVRGLAAQLEVVDKVWCEDELVIPVVVAKVKKIDASLLIDCEVTRKCFRDALDDDEATAENIEKTIMGE